MTQILAPESVGAASAVGRSRDGLRPTHPPLQPNRTLGGPRPGTAVRRARLWHPRSGGSGVSSYEMTELRTHCPRSGDADPLAALGWHPALWAQLNISGPELEGRAAQPTALSVGVEA